MNPMSKAIAKGAAWEEFMAKKMEKVSLLNSKDEGKRGGVKSDLKKKVKELEEQAKNEYKNFSLF